MFNPEEIYQLNALHIQQLRDESDHRRMLAALPQGQHMMIQAASMRLGRLLVSLGTAIQKFGPGNDRRPMTEDRA